MTSSTPPTAEILSQGDEVVTGQTVDSNAAWLAERLTELGFVVVQHTSVGDRLDDLQGLFRRVAGRCDLAICTGGLGPTDDDLTAQAVAEALNMPLRLDTEALAHIRALYASFQREMPAVNEKQAWLPTGSVRLDNDWGTAPGFAVQGSRAAMAFLPGVPREMKQLYQHRVLPWIQQRFDVAPAHLVTLRTTGVGESNLQERIGAVHTVPGALDHGMVLAYRTKLPENHIKLRFPAQTARAAIAGLTREVAGRIGTPLFSIEGADDLDLPGVDPRGGDVAQVVGRSLAARGQTLATAESCTGGRVAAACTAIPGSSAWFLQGAVTYSNASKTSLLGVDADAISTHGAVSEPVARQMAEGARAAAGSTWAIATTGIAGPTGGSDLKPVGAVHLAVAGPDGTHHRCVHLGGDRGRIQILATSAALDLLRRLLTSTSS